jgi:C-terminal processing protease CtpA/Prc
MNCDDKETISHKDSIKALSGEDLLKSFVFETMKVSYLWNEDLPESVNYNNYESAQALINGIANSKDKWSYVVSAKTSDDLFVQGKSLSWGIRIILHESENNIYIYESYKDSDFYKNGVNNRGWLLDKINNTEVTLQNYKTLLNATEEGTTIEVEAKYNNQVKKFTATYKERKVNTVDYVKTFDTKAGKIGYFYFNKFLGPSAGELDSAFLTLKNKNINKLIIDIRNNSGGYVYIADTLCKYISGNRLENKNFISYRLNDNLHYMEADYKFSDKIPANNLGLDEVYFLTSNGTASASELAINALREAGIGVKLIGTTTHGKAFGMMGMKTKEANLFNKKYGSAFNNYVEFSDPYTNIEYVLNAINFSNGNYADGFSPTTGIQDDQLSPYGDETKEKLLKYLINFFNDESSSSKVIIETPKLKLPELTGFDRAKGGLI